MADIKQISNRLDGGTLKDINGNFAELDKRTAGSEMRTSITGKVYESENERLNHIEAMLQMAGYDV